MFKTSGNCVFHALYVQHDNFGTNAFYIKIRSLLINLKLAFNSEIRRRLQMSNLHALHD